MPITIDATSTNLIFNGVASMFQSLLPIIIFFIAIQLSFYISRKIIAFMPKSYTRIK